jgi:hypothetical protein
MPEFQINLVAEGMWQKKPLDFNANNRIKDNLKAAMKARYLPISLNNLKVENRELYTRVTKSRIE